MEMAIQNSLVKKPAQEQERGITEYECGGQMVKLSPSIIKNYLVNGNGAVTDQEAMMFLSLCKFQKLNPFLREAYLIKYGNQPATIVTGKEAFLKRAVRNPNYAGHEAGIVVTVDETGDYIERVGTIVLDGETLVGGWAKVYVKGWTVPLMVTVAFDEYCQRKSDGTPMSNWATKPSTMIRKVALVQALREAFPEDLGRLYTADEQQDAVTQLEIVPVEVPEETAEEEPAPKQERAETPPAPSESIKPQQGTNAAANALFGKKN